MASGVVVFTGFIVILCVILVVTFAVSTRNPRLERRVRHADKLVAAYRLILLSQRELLGLYADTDAVAATILDDVNHNIDRDGIPTAEALRAAGR